MESIEIVDRLNERAFKLHRILSDNKVYLSDVSDSQFRQLVKSKIEDTARRLANPERTPWLTLIEFPTWLLFKLRDFIYLQTWDTEEGTDVLLEEFEELFERTPFHFSWSYSEEKQLLEYQIGDVKTVLECRSYNDFHYGNFGDLGIFGSGQIEDDISAYLKSQGWYLYKVASSDQVAIFLLLPISAVEPIRTLVVPIDSNLPDRRTDWMYKGGLPGDKKSRDIWEL